MKHKGIEHLAKIVSFIITLAGAIRTAAADGKIGFSDALAFWPVLREAPGAFRDLGEVPAELADLDAPEADELVRLVEARFGEILPAGRAVDIVDAALGVIPQLANLYATIVNPPPKAELAE